MSLLELASALAESISSAAARVANADIFRCTCEAIVTWLADAYQAGSLTLLEVAHHVAVWQTASAWFADRVNDGSMTLLQVANVVAQYIQHFS